MYNLIIALGFAFLSSPANAKASCANVAEKMDTAPVCPAVGTILSDNFPALAVTVSDTDGGADFVDEFVGKVLQAEGQDPPQIFLNVTQKNMERVQAHVKALAKTPQQSEKWLSALTRINSKYSLNWQQDYLQDFANPKTGLPEMRYVSGYERGVPHTDSLFSQLSKVAKQCGIQTGKPLPFIPSKEEDNIAGTYGGNLESLPADLCMVGTDHFEHQKDWDKYSRAVCGNRKTGVLKPPTSWLEVGHTDEIFKAITVPNRTPPCNVAYLIASPRKGLEILNAKREEKAFSMKSRLSFKQAEDYFWATQSLDIICSQHLALRSNKVVHPTRTSASNKKDDPRPCQDMTNAEFLRANQSLEKYNELVQSEMDQFRKDVEAELKRVQPSCEPDFIEVPDLFSGDLIKGKNGKLKLDRETGESIFPNPTNAVLLSPTLISSEPINPAFKTYLKEEYQRRGIKAEFVDTLFAHQMGGNLHCSTQVMRYCKPRN